MPEIHIFSRYPEPPHPHPADQGAAAHLLVSRLQDRARAEGRVCRYRLVVNAALFEWWGVTPHRFGDGVTVECDPRLFDGENLCHVETAESGE